MGKIIDQAAAEQIGRNFLKSLEPQDKDVSAAAVKTETKPAEKKLILAHKATSLTPFANRVKTKTGLKALTQKKNEEPCFYIFNGEDKGFVIVSADDAAEPVLGYSKSGRMDASDMPPAAIWYLEKFKLEIINIRKNKLPAGKEITKKWTDLKKGTVYKSAAATKANGKSVEPLIKTKWGQGTYYNKFCPQVCPTGCHATAMAQVMCYFSYPQQGTGLHTCLHADEEFAKVNLPASVTYDSKTKKVTVDFSKTKYRWDLMPRELTNGSVEEVNTVAELMLHCGISADMKYHWEGSAASFSDAEKALETYFKYYDMQIVNNYTDEIQGTIKILDSGHPVYYVGNDGHPFYPEGHAFIFDGYDENGKFHINWGWQGSLDGYFEITALTPGGNNINHDNRYYDVTPKEKMFTINVITDSEGAVNDFDADSEARPFIFPWGKVFVPQGCDRTFTVCENDYFAPSISVRIENTDETQGDSIVMTRYGDAEDNMYRFTVKNVQSDKNIKILARRKERFDYNGLIYIPEKPDYQTVSVRTETKNNTEITLQNKIRDSDKSEISYSLSAIASRGFSDYDGLINFSIGRENLIGKFSVRWAAFAGCKDLVNFKMDYRNLHGIEIGDAAFGNCTKLKGEIPFHLITYIGPSAFYKCESIESPIALGKLKQISTYAFFGCKKVPSLKLSPELSQIEESAFEGCGAIKEIYCFADNPPAFWIRPVFNSSVRSDNADNPPNEKSVFRGVPKNINVFVPENSIESYSKSALWGDFTNFKTIDFVYEAIEYRFVTSTALKALGRAAADKSVFVNIADEAFSESYFNDFQDYQLFKVEYIGKEAFLNDTLLQTVHFGIAEIGD
ncbi:MAG: C10 family peptidase, partial [Endomicrobium sp.]|nr:C10 family peptidase [Endomicrobium sp.]